MPSSERISGMLTSAHLPGNASRGMPLGNRLGKTHFPGNASWGMPLRESLFRASPASARSYSEFPAWLFIAFIFPVLFEPLWNATFSLLAPKNLPKWSPNPPKIQSKTCPKSILCCEGWKVNPSKHSHTFAHFCLSKRQENHPKIVSETAFLLDALKNGTKIDVFPIFNRLGLQTGSKMAAQNSPKIDQKLWKSIIDL